MAIEKPLDVDEVAQMLGIARRVAVRHCREKKLPAFQVGNRWRILPSSLQQWMKEQEQANRG